MKEARAVIKTAEQQGDKGTVTALVSVFGSEDSMGDVVAPGAFTKTLADWQASGDSIPVLWSHRMDDPNMVVGHVTKAEETDEGLQVTAQLDLDSANGAQVYRLLKGRRIKNWSFAYDVEEGGFVDSKSSARGGFYELRQLKLHEVSPCIVGANQDTRTDDVKSAPVAAYREARDRAATALERLQQAKGMDAVDAAYTAASKARSEAAQARKQALDEGVTEEELEQDMTHTEDMTALKAQVAELAELLKAAQPPAAKTEHVPAESKEAHAAAGGRRVETPEAKATMRQALQDLGNGVSGDGPAARDDVHPRVKASGGTKWGAQVVAGLGGPQGYKGVLANGTVAVDVPLDPEPVRSDIPVLSLRQLMPNVRNTTGRFAYLRQTVRTNNAAVVAHGAKKPTSLYTLARVDDRVRTIAHLSEPIAKQDLDDIGLLRTFIDQEMRLGLDVALEREILSGDGTGEHFTGMANVSGAQVQAFSSNVLTTTRKAVTKLERWGYLARAGWVMTPEDWETIELLADNEGQFYYGGPQAAVNASSRRLWSVPVVVSDAATTGTAHLADFSQMRLQVRQDGVLDWSENMYDPNALGAGQGASDFERNMLRFRFEGRFGLEILRPSAIVEVDMAA
ncbi:HK97 family phage prohead protease [Streptomyces sp. NPDC088745]|uniref:HK97 family phage prohead protease n=1 Tax=Streptomyces sp. NPDC088745 TaxID=3365884 RepID=UPI0037F496B4